METRRRPQDLCDIAFSETDGWAERLSAATTLIGELQTLQGQLVTAGRTEDASWVEIGKALGVSTQAAHKRFKPKSATAPASPKPVSAPASKGKAQPTSTREKQGLSPSAPTENEVPTPALGAGGLVAPLRTEPDGSPSVWGYTAWVGGVPVVRVERVLGPPASGARRGRWGRRARRA